MDAEWEIAAKARTDFADMIEGLTPDQLSHPSLCDDWSVQDVAGHIVSFIELSLPALMLSMMKGRFDVHAAWFANAKKYGAQPIADIASTIRSNAAHPSAARWLPAGVTTVDVAVHTQDIRRAINLDGALDSHVVRGALEFCTCHDKRKLILPPDHIANLRLEATDLDWSWGSGALVRGSGEAVLMGINRRNVEAELEGDGVSQLPKKM